MAVLIEAISVVIRCISIGEKFPGGWEGFVSDVPNNTLCADGEFARVAFMDPVDAESYIKDLEQYGILYLVNGVAHDIVVADQQHGLSAPCDWVEFYHVSLDGENERKVAVCRASGCSSSQLSFPDGWEYEKSLSCKFAFMPLGRKDKNFKFLRHENGLDVYLNLLTGKEYFTGRTSET